MPINLNFYIAFFYLQTMESRKILTPVKLKDFLGEYDKKLSSEVQIRHVF